MNGHTHEFEPTFGFPESLPASEKVLWQGSPCAWLIARRIFFLPHLFIYFLILSCMALIFNSEALTLKDVIIKFMSYMSLGMVAIFLLLAISHLISSTTVYSITDKRVVMRIGIVLNLSLNIPFSKIETAACKEYQDKSGDISIKLVPDNKIAYLHLWPHCRPWFFSAPRPRLSCLKDVEVVASRLTSSWEEQKLLVNRANAKKGLL
ncbi:photosynthetic complex putative assembly protein PuhB [Betaproteobacteria bacterium]|nr:photosynthetic complex putative assembly protein PuhB [Betaproteobacteria bacterium]